MSTEILPCPRRFKSSPGHQAPQALRGFPPSFASPRDAPTRLSLPRIRHVERALLEQSDVTPQLEVRRDPALEKLLRELPHKDPDEPELARVWIENCDGGGVVTVGVESGVRFGPWRGKPIRLGDVVIHARKLASGEEVLGRIDPSDGDRERIVQAGCRMVLQVLIE